MTLYEEIGNQLGITAAQVKDRLVNGETLVQAYYEWKYNWNTKDDTTICF